MYRYTDIRNDWRLLDEETFEVPSGIELLSHEAFASPNGPHVEQVRPSSVIGPFRMVPALHHLLYALQLLMRCRNHSVLIVNGSSPLWLAVGLLNQTLFCLRKRRVLCWALHAEPSTRFSREIMRWGLKGTSLSLLWSKNTVSSHVEFFQLPETRFLFMPYKANHSKELPYKLSLDNYVFAGGNSKRDYDTLLTAIKGTGIPLVISSTDPEVKSSLRDLSNVTVVSAVEPEFAELQAASRFVVMPMHEEGIRGAGEANICNAMWHGKPVIAADNISAHEYIQHGQTGFVVPSGDTKALRDHIIRLWNNPELTRTMGEAAHRHVVENFTQSSFSQRLRRLSAILGTEEFFVPHIRTTKIQLEAETPSRQAS
ncbi:MAG: glycosyltransferase family 4 protein [Candidatus Eisenbacteria bacterium]|uniref:Glycosyltransferase family 4 protein n=1 Tax=Eiseniibacteriota bacterium TaxID=2212470 RepID=A0A7Y2H418_UNCEI|nr:glycosyltransferase family 4 protein [Candidatus Eisenbacteria bacterium]